jgi:CRP/FNR family transcriptional regulator
MLLTMNQDIASVFEKAATVQLDAGQAVFHQGQYPEHYVIVVDGCVKVFARSVEGREVVIYRVRENEMCLLTTSCILGQTPLSADAVTEEPTVAKLLPLDAFEKALHESVEFRRFIFEGMGRHLARITQRFEHLVLDSIERRLIRLLIKRSMAGSTIVVTHEKLASEIGTAREVVSRHLKSLQAEGLIRIGRGQIEITDHAALNQKL